MRHLVLMCCSVFALVSGSRDAVATADELNTDLARKLASVQFTQYATAPGYSEGPTWNDGFLYFCSGSLYRVDREKTVHQFLEIGPAGTVIRADGHLLICDNKNKALLDLAPDGRVGVIAERFEMETLRSLNDLTIDARGNVYWTDPEGSTPDKPAGNIYRLRPDGRIDRLATRLAFPNGLEVDPANRYLYVIESQSRKILRYDLPADHELLGKPTVFYDLGGSGGDGCAFDENGNLWVADFHRPDAKKGRIIVLSPDAKVLAYLTVPSELVSNITFGGPQRDEIFCTTGGPAGVFRAQVGVKGFAGHPGRPFPVIRYLNAVTLRSHPDASVLRRMAQVASDAILEQDRFPAAVRHQLAELLPKMTDRSVQKDTEKMLGDYETAAIQSAKDKRLLAEIQRLNGKVIQEVVAPDWLRSIVSDGNLPVFRRIVEIDLNERTDGHAEPVPKKLSDRVTDDWLKNLAGQDRLRRLELSGTAITSDGLVYLKDLRSLERLNVCLTATDDRGFEHLADLTKMKRMIICASKITGSGFQHLGRMKQLESINLHSAPASDQGLKEIGKLTSLKRLEIVHTHVTDAGLQHLAALVNLEQLHVHGPETTEHALPFLGQLKQLYQLDIYDKAASNATLKQIRQLPRLRMLMLPNGVFDDQGVQELKNLQSLEELSLQSSKVTDASVDVLGTLKNLRKVDLNGTQITKVGREKLRNDLPRAIVLPEG